MAYFVKKWVWGHLSILRANFNLKPFAKITTLTVIITLDLHRKFKLYSLIGFTVILFCVWKNVPIEMCTTQSSLTPVQTLWQAKRTLTMNAMGKVLTEKSWNFLCLSIMWFSFGLVTFKRQIGDDVGEIVIKRPRLNFDQNCHFHKNEKSKFNETFRNGFLGNKTIKWLVYIKKKYLEGAKKAKNVDFNTLERPSWIVQFLGRGTLDFELFFIFFFENGIRRYQVTNLSCDGFDLKLCPENDPL